MGLLLSVFVDVNGSEIGTKSFASLYVSVCKADKIGLKGEQWSKYFLCTLKEPYIILGLVPTGFRCFGITSDILIESTSFLYILDAFFLTENKI